METFFSLLALCEGNPLVTGEFPSKGQWRKALILSLICAWTNRWANHRDADDLRHHRAHYDVTLIAWYYLELVICRIIHISYMPQSTGSSLVHTMHCSLLGAKSLSIVNEIIVNKIFSNSKKSEQCWLIHVTSVWASENTFHDILASRMNFQMRICVQMRTCYK